VSGIITSHYPLGLEAIPSSWESTTVGEAMRDIQPGFASGVHNQEGLGIPHLRPMNVDREGRLDLSVVKYVSPGKALRIRAGDVLFNNTNSAELIGKTTHIGIDTELAFSNHMTRLRPGEGIDPRFVGYQLHFLWMTGYFLHRCTHHVNQASISSTTLAETVPFVVPPSREQVRIVEEIEKQFTRLDAAVGALKRVQANLKRYRAAVLKAACEGRLVPTEAELAQREGRSYEPAAVLLERILAERRGHLGEKQSKHKPPRSLDFSGMPHLSEGWTWTSFDQLLVYLRNGIPQKPDAESGQPILRISAVRPMKVDLEDVRYLRGDVESYSEYIVEDGDLLFTRYNGNPTLTGVCGVVRSPVVKIVHPDKLIRAQVPKRFVDPLFLEIVLNTGASRRFLESRTRTTAGQSGISGSDLRSVPVPLAPYAEQLRIATEADRRLSNIDAMQTEVESDLKRADRLRQAILKRAFEGKLVPQDPSDEPARVLLERIRAERGVECRGSRKGEKEIVTR
jgi:type I restriction enzyme S subunit